MRVAETKVYSYGELNDKAKARARDWYREASAGDNHYADSVIEDAGEIAARLGIEFKQREYKTAGGKTRHEPAVSWSGFSCQGDGASFEGQLVSLEPDYETAALRAGFKFYETTGKWHATDQMEDPDESMVINFASAEEVCREQRIHPVDGSALANVKAYAPTDETLHAIAARLDALQGKYDYRLAATISLSRGNYSHSGMMQIEANAIDAEGDDKEVPHEDWAELTKTLRAFADWIYLQLQNEYDYQNSDENVAETIEANDYEFTENGKRFVDHG